MTSNGDLAQRPSLPSSSRSSLRRNVSQGHLFGGQVDSKVLVIYTGGTIGMVRNERNGKNYITIRG